MSNQKGGAHAYAEQFGTIKPQQVDNTQVVRGYDESLLSFPTSMRMNCQDAGKKRRSRSRSPSKSKSKRSSSSSKKSIKKKSTRSRKMRGGAEAEITGLGSSQFSNAAPIGAESQRNTIPLETIATPDWVNNGQKPGPPPYAAESSVGWNEYQFGRTTPDNKFIVATGLVPKPGALEMIGAGKKKKSTKKSSKSSKSSLLSEGKKTFSKIGDTFIKSVSYVGKKSKNTLGYVGKKTYNTVSYVGKKTKNTLSYVGKKTSNTVKSVSSSLSSKKGKSKKSKKSKKSTKKSSKKH